MGKELLNPRTDKEKELLKKVSLTIFTIFQVSIPIAFYTIFLKG